MTSERIAVCLIDAPSAPELQRHVLPGGGAHCDLYTWEVDPPRVDAGPPPIVEDVFAASLVRCATLAFRADSTRKTGSQQWTITGEGSWLWIPPTLGDRLRRRLPPWILATRHVELARQLFSGTVSWDQQQQVGFLLRAGPLPILERRLVVQLLGARDLPIYEFELPNEVIALVLPATDGDYLEIVAREASTRDAIRATIMDECVRRGLPFHVLNSLVPGGCVTSDSE